MVHWEDTREEEAIYKVRSKWRKEYLLYELMSYRYSDEIDYADGQGYTKVKPSTPTYRTYPIGQFDVKYGGTACTTISIVAIYRFIVDNVGVDSIDWEEVIRKGAVLWKKCKEMGNINMNFLTTDSVNCVPVFKEFLKDKLHVEIEFFGYLHEKNDGEFSFDLEHGINELCKYESVGAVFTYGAISVSLLCKGDNIYMFDSHGISNSGAVLYEFKGKEELLKLLRKRTVNYAEYSLTLYLKKEEEEDEFSHFFDAFNKITNKGNIVSNEIKIK